MTVSGNDYSSNDHIALQDDLATLDRLGWRVLPLQEIVRALLEGKSVRKAVGLSFDDGSWFDWHDIQHPAWGLQRGFAGILRDASTRMGYPVRGTSFVIVSPSARETLDRTCMIGRGWWQSEWWSDSHSTGPIDIQNHSWDHNHPTLSHTVQRKQIKGRFDNLETWEEAELAIKQAQDWLVQNVGTSDFPLFAYPYGQYSDYLANEYFPQFKHQHKICAAFTTEPRPITSDANRWILPRFVCGSDWKSPEGLRQIIQDST